MKKYGHHIIINSEKHISSDLGEFLDTKPSKVNNFTIEELRMCQAGTYSHNEARIFLLLIYSYEE